MAKTNNSNLAKPSQSTPSRAVILAQQQIYAGPIPSADEFAKYEAVLPGSADRILKMAENQSKHRQEIEKKVVASNISNSRRGQLFGFIISILVIILGFVLILLNKDAMGFVLVIGDLVYLVSIFIYNRISESKELKQKRKAPSKKQS